MGDLQVILTSPTGTAVTLLDGDFAGQSDFTGNLGWDNPINGGDLYSFYGEDTVGTWTLQDMSFFETPVFCFCRHESWLVGRSRVQ